MQVLDAGRDVSSGYKVDVTRGERVGRVSSEWFSRPDDERFLSLGELAAMVRGRADHSRSRLVETSRIHVEASRSNAERLALVLPGADAPVEPNHWSFGQLAAQIGAPAAYLRQLPAALAGINLQYGLTALLEVYAEDGMTLDQLMAFSVSGDHARQDQVFERLKASYDKQRYTIRRMLTEGAVRACDKRAPFIGLEAYVEAGGTILRDLFQGDDGGWLQDVALVDRLGAEKLKAEADAVAAEGWKWVEMAPDFAYGHTYGLRQLRGETVLLTAEEETCRDALQAEFDRLSTEYAEADELPEEVDARRGEIETAIEAFEACPITFDPLDVARAGAFVSIAHDGAVRIERGYVRPEDGLPVELEVATEDAGPHHIAAAAMRAAEAVMADAPTPEPEEDEGLSAMSDRLMTELTSLDATGRITGQPWPPHRLSNR